MTKLSEPQPTQELLDKHPEWQDETRRPMFLLIAAVKHEQRTAKEEGTMARRSRYATNFLSALVS
jgi:hypothetical protein